MIEPFTLAIPEAELVDLRNRLAATRWPEDATAEGWVQGVPLSRMREVVEYWRDSYDWRRCEAMLNGFGQFRATLEGLGIHFLHSRSPHENALPLVLTHGWPGSVVEFHKVIKPLTDPTAFGGRAEDAFHVVAPSLPGYGFSDKPAAAGWDVDRIGRAWGALMTELGYRRYVAQGGDWGSAVTVAMGKQRPEGLAGIHLNMVFAFPPPDQPLDEEGHAAAALLERYDKVESGYAKQQATRPQTLGYGLADSPAGQAAWIYEKFQRWSDCNGDPETVLSRDEILDDIMLYWLTNTGASSARLYWESAASGFKPEPIHLPVGASIFPKELSQPPRQWAEPIFPQLIHWNKMEKGGHFAAFEQPELFVREVRDCFRQLR